MCTRTMGICSSYLHKYFTKAHHSYSTSITTMDGCDDEQMEGWLDWITYLISWLERGYYWNNCPPGEGRDTILDLYSNSIHLKANFYMPLYKMTTFLWIWSERLINCIKGAEVSRMELKPFPRTISRWDGRCMSAPPVGLWAPPVPFGNQWPPCTGWCPGSSLIR